MLIKIVFNMSRQVSLWLKVNTTVAKLCPSYENLVNRKDLIKMYIDMSLLQLTDEYHALNHCRLGEYDSALRICREIRTAQNPLGGIVCSKPFDLLIEDDLAKIINSKSDSGIVKVSR